MNRLLALAIAAPMLLIGAADPNLAAADAVASGAPAPAPVTYRPCRPGPGDDNCIQLYERGVRPAYARWLRTHGGDARPAQAAVGGPIEPRARPARARHARAGHRPHAAADTRCPPQAHRPDSGETRGM